MNKVLILGQGSQSIQLIRELFSIGIRPDDLEVISIEEFKAVLRMQQKELHKITYFPLHSI
tara:strand:+ start:96 stop:278 length:183 start_codon:yes stop_codon:yes gene_type:complete